MIILIFLTNMTNRSPVKLNISINISIITNRSAVKLNILIQQGPPSPEAPRHLGNRSRLSQNTPRRGQPALEYSTPPWKQEPPDSKHTSLGAPGSRIHHLPWKQDLLGDATPHRGSSAGLNLIFWIPKRIHLDTKLISSMLVASRHPPRTSSHTS